MITFLRTPNLPPTFAKFIVPLTFNKLDLRDYLFHVYGVNVLRVRSYVEQQKVQSKGKVARRWYRPRAIKKMTVEMDKPFIWPKEPDDFSAYDYGYFKCTRYCADHLILDGIKKRMMQQIVIQRRLKKSLLLE